MEYLELKEISHSQAKREITRYIDHTVKNMFYPSDIADKLNISYLTVQAVLNELEHEGRVGTITKCPTKVT